MPVYIAIPLRHEIEPLKKAVQIRVSPENRHELQGDSGWLINFSGTTIELCNHLGITGQDPGVPSPVGASLVVPITSYYGRGPSDMWEWIKTRIEA